MKTTALFGASAVIALAIAMPAIAQDAAMSSANAAAPMASARTQAAPDDSSGIQDIVVTANKREQNLNKVGLSISAITGDALKERQIVSLADVAASVPGLSFAQSANNTPILSLRGVGFNESSLGNYPAVSVYVDQAPLQFPVMASHSSYDLQRVEVLKGPQGTLFGQNSTGGAINYVPAHATTHFEGGGDISYGRFNRVEGNVFIGGPITDTLKTRLAVNGVNSDGWQISNTRPYDRNGAQSYVAGRMITDWDPTDRLHVSLNVNGWLDRSEPQAGQFFVLDPQTQATVKPQELSEPLTTATPRNADWTPGSGTPRSDRKFFQTSLRADFKIAEALTLTSLTSYNYFKQNQTQDTDGSALVIGDITRDEGTLKSFNQEIRLANDASSTIRWVVGGNYEDSRTNELQTLRFPDTSNNSAGLNFISQDNQQSAQRIRNYAVFGNLEYDVTDKLTVKAGVRYTKSKNTGTSCQYDVGDGALAGLFNILGGLLGSRPFTPAGVAGPAEERCVTLNADLVPALRPFQATLSEDNVSWRAGVDYKFTNTLLGYVNVSRGYKAGSFPVLAASTETQYAPVVQESVTAYEAGIKAGLFDRTVQLNAAAFYYDYRNKQILGKKPDAVFGPLDALINVPKSRVMGLEGDVTIIPVPGLTLQGSLTYLDTKITDYVGSNPFGITQNFEGEKLPFAPRLSYSVNASYRHELANGGAPFVGASILGRSSQDTTIGGSGIMEPSSPVIRTIPGLVHPFKTNAYATIDLRAGYEAPDSAWRVTVWGRNIFNKYYWNNVITSDDARVRFTGLPASYGVTFAVKFN